MAEEMGSSVIVLEMMTGLDRIHRRFGEYALSLMSSHLLGADLTLLPSISLAEVNDGMRFDLVHSIRFGYDVGAFHEIELGMRLVVSRAGYAGAVFAEIFLEPPDERFPNAGSLSHEWPAAGGSPTEILDALEECAVRLCAMDDPFGFLGDYGRLVQLPTATLPGMNAGVHTD